MILPYMLIAFNRLLRHFRVMIVFFHKHGEAARSDLKLSLTDGGSRGFGGLKSAGEQRICPPAFIRHENAHPFLNSTLAESLSR